MMVTASGICISGWGRERFGNVFIGSNLIRDVERSDEGQYMCQINTARAKTRLGNLHVVGE